MLFLFFIILISVGFSNSEITRYLESKKYKDFTNAVNEIVKKVT